MERPLPAHVSSRNDGRLAGSVPGSSSQDGSDGGYISYGDGAGPRVRRKPAPSAEGMDGAPSERTTSTAPLNRGGPTGFAAGAPSRGGSSDPDKRSYVSSDESSLDDAYAAGMPIGFLAALGTPYAKKPLYRSKKCKVLCLAVVPLALIVTVIITVIPVLHAIAKHALHTSVIHVYISNITNPTDTGFNLTLEGQVKKTGIFPAEIFFTQPQQVYWVNPDNMQELLLGSFNLAPLNAAVGHAMLKQETYFNIANESAFGRFAEYLITQESFTWRLYSPEVQAKAFSFLATNGLEFQKDTVINGFANFTDVKITDFQLPGNDPAGGITVAVTTSLNNPSPFGVEIGTLSVDLYYDGLYLGPASTYGPINVTQGLNMISLGGHLLDYSNNPDALAKLGVLFSNYLNGIATPVQAVGKGVVAADGNTPQWLQQGIQSLILNVPLQSPTGRISPIKSITIESFNLVQTPSTAYDPVASSPNILAGIGLPFGFSLNISNVANTFNIIQNNSLVAGINGVFGASATDIQTMNAGYTTAVLSLALPDSNLNVPSGYDAHLLFDQFQSDLANTDGSNFYLNGTTNAVTQTPIGQVALKDIGFQVPAGLVGLSGLAEYPTLLISVDVTGGTPDYLELAIEVGLTNPSNLNLSVGDVTFQLFATDGSFLGRATLPNLNVELGYQQRPSVGEFEANSNPTALRYLNDFASGRANDLMISGFNGSTQVESLTQAFMGIHLKTTLNGLAIKLLQSASLEVLPTTGITNNIADAYVALNNPFSAALDITNIQSNVTARGIFVGRITVDTNFNAPGKQTTLSPSLDFVLNLFPPDIFSLLRELVLESGQNPAYLDGIVQLGDYQYVPTTGPSTKRMKRSLVRDEDAHLFEFEEDVVADEFGRTDYSDLLMSPVHNVAPGEPLFANETGHHQAYKRSAPLEKRANLYTGFDLPPYVDKAFQSLTSNVALVSTVKIGDFVTDLTYSQEGLTTLTDSSLNLLLPVLAQPIVQKIVDGAVLSLDHIIITSPQNTNFGTQLVGAITNSGPFDAIIQFPQGLTVAWNGAPIGQIAMPNVGLVGDVGANLNLQAGFQVADVGHLTDFTSYFLNEPSFTWQIYGQQLNISALGIAVPGISIAKEVLLSGANGFKNDVTITSFDLPYNDPAGGIHLTIATQLTNPGSIGVELSQLAFMNTYGSTTIGPAAAESGFTLEPKTTISLPLAGRLVPQSGQGLTDVSTLFNGFVHGVPSSLVVHGQAAGPDSVQWLNGAIKTLNIPVVLPAAASLKIVNAITINQITLAFTPATSWSPAFSTDNSIIAFQLPFAFPLSIDQLASNINPANPDDTGTEFALIAVPQVATTTDVVSRMTNLQFSNVPFAVFGNTHDIFSQFLTDTTDGVTKTFGLTGTANTVAGTAVGSLNIDGIAFSVDTTVLGLQGLNARQAYVTDLDVYHGYPSYLQINVNAHLYNPSNITLIVSGDTALTLSYTGQLIGRAVIVDLNLVPGENITPVQVRYMPTSGAPQRAGETVLENFVQAIPSTTQISADDQTTQVQSLTQALESLELNTVIPPLMQNLVTKATIEFPLDIVQTGVAMTVATIDDPFTASINIESLIAFAVYQGIPLGNITQPNLNPAISIPGHTTANSPTLPLNFNLDPRVIIRLLELRSQVTGTNLGPLPDQFAYVLGLNDAQLANVTGNIQTMVDQTVINQGFNSQCNSGGQFDVFDAILDALRGLEVTLELQTIVSLDQYVTPLNFNQYNVPAVTDRTALYLIGAVGKPIVQHLVDEAVLTFSAGNITNVTDNGFTAALSGQLLDTGPFDAYISIPNPGLTVTWQGQDIATITIPPICAAANIAVPDLETTGILTITNLNGFTQFATFILHNPSFTWVVHTDRIMVNALGTIFDYVKIAKVISFLAFNNLPGVTIQNFDLPSDASGCSGINIVTGSMIPSPSNLGIELGTANFIAYFEGNEVGPVAAMNLFLARLTTTDTTLTGEIIKQSGNGVQTLGVLFSRFLQGLNSTLNVQGQSVISPAQPNSPVNWLSAAFQTLTINVTLPGVVYKIIQSAKINDFELVLQNAAQDYHIDTSNRETDLTFQNPFGFSLSITEVAAYIIIGYQGANTAILTTAENPPLLSGTSVGQGHSPGSVVPLEINFQNRSLDVYPGAETSYQNFIAAVADTQSATFTFQNGTYGNVSAQTCAGNIPISGVPIFDITSVFTPAINSFQGGGVNGVQIPNAPIVVGSGSADSRYQIQRGAPDGNKYIRIDISSILIGNPANITLATNDVALPTYYRGASTEFVGRAVVSPLNLIPGVNNLTGQFQYGPTSLDTVTQDFVTQYLYGNPAIPLTITDSPAPNDGVPSTPYGSLLTALDNLAPLEGTFPGLGSELVQDIEIFLSLAEGLCKNTTSITFALNNNLEASITLKRVINKSFQGSYDVRQANANPPANTEYAFFDHSFTNYYFARPQTNEANALVYTEPILVTLAQGLAGSLPLLTTQDAAPRSGNGQGLDLINTIDNFVGAENAGNAASTGYELPSLSYNQNGVHFHINLYLVGNSSTLAAANPSGDTGAQNIQGITSVLTNPAAGLQFLGEILTGQCAGLSLTEVCELVDGLLGTLGGGTGGGLLTGTVEGLFNSVCNSLAQCFGNIPNAILQGLSSGNLIGALEPLLGDLASAGGCLGGTFQGNGSNPLSALCGALLGPLGALGGTGLTLPSPLNQICTGANNGTLTCLPDLTLTKTNANAINSVLNELACVGNTTLPLSGLGLNSLCTLISQVSTLPAPYNKACSEACLSGLTVPAAGSAQAATAIGALTNGLQCVNNIITPVLTNLPLSQVCTLISSLTPSGSALPAPYGGTNALCSATCLLGTVISAVTDLSTLQNLLSTGALSCGGTNGGSIIPATLGTAGSSALQSICATTTGLTSGLAGLLGGTTGSNGICSLLSSQQQASAAAAQSIAAANAAASAANAVLASQAAAAALASEAAAAARAGQTVVQGVQGVQTTAAATAVQIIEAGGSIIGSVVNGRTLLNGLPVTLRERDFAPPQAVQTPVPYGGAVVREGQDDLNAFIQQH